MARARELLRRTRGPQGRIPEPSSAIRAKGIDHYAGSLRRRGRNLPSRGLQLDGARLSVRKRSGEHLVGRAPARRRGLRRLVRVLPLNNILSLLTPENTNLARRYFPVFQPDRTRRSCSIRVKHIHLFLFTSLFLATGTAHYS